MTLLTRAARTASALTLLGVGACSLDTGDVNEPKSLIGAASSTQNVTTGKPATISVFVLNQFGEPIMGSPVTFAVSAGAGTLSTTSVATSVQGLAEATFTPSKAGTSVVRVSVSGLNPITFTVIAAD